MTIRTLLDRQSGVVRRAQLRAWGASPNDIRRWLRQRHLVRLYPGVYLNHDGPLTWVNRPAPSPGPRGRSGASTATGPG